MYREHDRMWARRKGSVTEKIKRKEEEKNDKQKS